MNLKTKDRLLNEKMKKNVILQDNNTRQRVTQEIRKIIFIILRLRSFPYAPYSLTFQIIIPFIASTVLKDARSL